MIMNDNDMNKQYYFMLIMKLKKINYYLGKGERE